MVQDEEMRTTFAQRLAQAAERAGLKEHGRSTAIARALGVSTKAVSNWFAGRAQPDDGRIDLLSSFLNVNKFWLMGASSDPSVSAQLKIAQELSKSLSNLPKIDPSIQATLNKISATTANLPNSYHELIRLKRETNELQIPDEKEWESVVTWDSNTSVGDDEVEVPFLKDIELACGDGAHSEQDYNGFKLRFSKATLRRFGAPSDGSTIFCFPAKGDSMEPVIPEGSTVTINIADKQIVDGKVYAINQDGWKRLKLLYRTGPNKVSIRSYNPDYNPEEANLNEIEIIGRMVHMSVLF